MFNFLLIEFIMIKRFKYFRCKRRYFYKKNVSISSGSGKNLLVIGLFMYI